MPTKTRKIDAAVAEAFPWLATPAESTEAVKPVAAALGVVSVAPVPRVCLSRSDAARALGIGLSTLKALEREGIAPPAFDAPGGRKLYPVASLVQWANDRAQGGFQGLHDGAGRATDVVDGCLTPDDSDA